MTPVESPAEAPPLTEEQEKMLKALGYVGDSEPNEEGLQARCEPVAEKVADHIAIEEVPFDARVA